MAKFMNDRRRAAHDRSYRDWNRSPRLQPVRDERETNPDPCPRSQFGKHRFRNKRLNANGRLMCDFCGQEALSMEKPK